MQAVIYVSSPNINMQYYITMLRWIQRRENVHSYKVFNTKNEHLALFILSRSFSSKYLESFQHLLNEQRQDM